MIKTAMSFALGCALLLQLADLPSAHYLWLTIPALVLVRFAPTRYLAIASLGMLWCLFYSHQIINDRLSPDLAGQELTIKGIVATVPARDQHKIRFEFIPDLSSQLALPKRLSISWYSPLPDSLTAGESWQLRVKLKQPYGTMNPGGFDYEAWLFQHHIGATAYVRATDTNHKLAKPPFYSINKLRQNLADKIKFHLEDSQFYGLIQGLTTGIKNDISQTQWQALRATGTAHLLAISGLHIGLAAMIGFVCFRRLWSLRSANLLLLSANEMGAIAGFITALFYAAMAGFSLPTQRALIMVATAMLALLIRRPIDSKRILALSLFLVLVWDPLSILSAGLWLSFTAVTIIIFVSQNRFPAIVWQWLKIHYLIALGISPLLLLFFMQTSLIAPLANLIAVPFISFVVVPLVLLASVIIWIIEPLGIVLFQFADSLLSHFWPILTYFASLPIASWSGPPLSFFHWLSIIIATIIVLTPKATPAKWLGLVGFAPLLLTSPERPQANTFWFYLLDVGQGLSAVIQTQHHTLVFDTGAKFSDRFDSGKTIIIPFLKHHGISHIDSLIVSHGDNDHKGGAPALIDAFTIDQIYTSVPDLFSESQPCLAGQSWRWDGITFSILNPYPDDVDSDNNLSCVLKVSAASGSVLLTGDIEFETEQRLIKRYGQALQSSLLVAPHHGSKTSSSAPFIEHVQPDTVLFPVGYANRYHFPAKEVVARYKHAGARVANSAADGAILVKFNDDKINHVIGWRQQARKIWTQQPDATD
ncbi:MAG: DNA internalization-related competence protein ComEC/Rec2 [Gammaproteobacteria bacterium]|nr:DNA internalization-related competence protein ComEC/Rec2 [Gammaproteobacteria bacterium]